MKNYLLYSLMIVTLIHTCKPSAPSAPTNDDGTSWYDSGSGHAPCPTTPPPDDKK